MKTFIKNNDLSYLRQIEEQHSTGRLIKFHDLLYNYNKIACQRTDAQINGTKHVSEVNLNKEQKIDF